MGSILTVHCPTCGYAAGPFFTGVGSRTAVIGELYALAECRACWILFRELKEDGKAPACPVCGRPGEWYEDHKYGVGRCPRCGERAMEIRSEGEWE